MSQAANHEKNINNTKDPINVLGAALTNKIFLYLDYKDLKNVEGVSLQWKASLDQYQFWQRFIQSHYLWGVFKQKIKLNFNPTEEEKEQAHTSIHRQSSYYYSNDKYNDQLEVREQTDSTGAKEFLRDYYSFPQVGDCIETVDTVNKWVVCRVVYKLNRDVFLVDYEGWGPKWLSWFDMRTDTLLIRPCIGVLGPGSKGIWDEELFHERTQAINDRIQRSTKTLWETQNILYKRLVLTIPEEYMQEAVKCHQYHLSLVNFIDANKQARRNTKKMFSEINDWKQKHPLCVSYSYTGETEPPLLTNYMAKANINNIEDHKKNKSKKHKSGEKMVSNEKNNAQEMAPAASTTTDDTFIKKFKSMNPFKN